MPDLRGRFVARAFGNQVCGSAPKGAAPGKGTYMHITVGLIIMAIIVGRIVGALGRLFVPGRQHIGILATIGIGIVAALIGTIIAGALGVRDTPGIDWIQLIIQVALAALGVALVSGGISRRRI